MAKRRLQREQERKGAKLQKQAEVRTKAKTKSPMPPWGRTLLLTLPAAVLIALGALHGTDRMRENEAQKGQQVSASTVAAHDMETHMNEFISAAQRDEKDPEYAAKRRVMGSRIYPNTQYCVSCHSFSDLDRKAGQKLGLAEKKITELFGKDALHSNVNRSIVFFTPSQEIETPGADASSTAVKVNFSLPSFVRSEGLNTAVHELVHHLVYRPFQYIHEPWAYTAEYLSDPELIRNPDQMPTLGLKHGIALMQRGFLFSKSGGRVVRPEDNADAIKIAKQLGETMSPSVIRAMRPLYKRAMSEYLRNDVFWDSASAGLLHQYLVQDVMIAQELARTKNPAFREAQADTKALSEAVSFFNQRRRMMMNQDYTRATYDVFGQFVSDLRQDFHHTLQHAGGESENRFGELSKKNGTQQDAAYYAALHRMFITPEGKINAGAVPQEELEKHARFKADRIARTLAAFDSQTIGTEDKEENKALDAKLAPFYESRKGLLKAELNRMNALLASRKYVR